MFFHLSAYDREKTLKDELEKEKNSLVNAEKKIELLERTLEVMSEVCLRRCFLMLFDLRFLNFILFGR